MLLLRLPTQGAENMIRSALGKVTWMARATTTVVGLAIMLALVLGVATSAMGANGQSFILGSLYNKATALTKLTGNVNGAAMQVVNNNADANDTALSLVVQSGEAPMSVNSTKKVANLNADRIDDREASSFANATHAHAGEHITSGTVAEARIDPSVARDAEVMDTVKANDGAGSGLDADLLDGKDSSAFMGDDLSIEIAQLAYSSDYTTREFSVDCPLGKRATGGGARVEGDMNAPNIVLTQSWPSGSGWSARASEISPTDEQWSLAVFAVCAPVSP